jgi:hypothetical protein
LHLESDTPVITLRDTSAYSAGTGPFIQFQGLDSGSTNRVFGQIYGLSNGSNSGELAFYTRNSGSTAERLRIDSSGRVTKPYQVYFRASPNGGSYVTTSPIQFSVASANVGSAFNTGTSTFTAPVAGRYMFHLHLGVVRVSIAGSDVYPRFRVNGASREYSYYLSQSVTNYSNTNITAIYELNANDYLDVTIVCGGTSAYYNGSSECVLTGYLLG